MTDSTACPDCGAAIGAVHHPDCDVRPPAARMESTDVWTGEWPGVRECRERGWYARPGLRGWEPCAADDDGAMEDLNRLTYLKINGTDGLYS